MKEHESILQVHDVSFEYDDKPIVCGVSFSLSKGDCVSMIGPNGAGKTTLLRLLSRILIPSKGDVLLGNVPLGHLSRHQIAREIAVVPQDTSLGFPFSVLEVVLMGRSPFTGMLGLESEQDYQRAFDSMERLDILDLAERRFDSLSGGEKQRTILARALTQTPRLLLLDEPGTHLDLSHQLAIHELLRQLSQEGITVLAITHDLNLAAEFFPRMIAMKNGRLVVDGMTEDVLTETRMEEVFGVKTFVDRNPVSGRPRLSLLGGHSPS